MREIVTLERMHRAFESGLMEYGMAKAVKKASVPASAPKAAAEQQGFTQVLWLDGRHREFLDEVGTMNIMLRIGDTVVTPPLTTGTILDGITRDSVLQLLRD